MSLETVRAFFAARAPEIEILETEASSATVALAAAVHHVEPSQIAKTISLRAGDTILLVVMSGTARLDNRKFRDRFGAKARMLEATEVESLTGHPVGGVCPFGLATPMPIYCDQSLRAFNVVVPAAGAVNAAVKITPGYLAELCDAQWVDVCQVAQIV